MKKFDEVIQDLEKKIYYPVYFLSGEEPYYIDFISDFIEEHVLDEQDKEFNQSVVYGRDTSVLDVVSMAKRFPMMAPFQVVIVKEAQYLDKIEQLSDYIQNPLESTLLVINYKYKKIDKRKKFAKLIDEKGTFFESPRIYENQIPAWIINHVGKNGYSITPKAAAMLTEYLGNDLSKIVNETGKLFLNVPAATRITDIHIEENIGMSKDYNVFELQNAIGIKDMKKAYRIAYYFAANPKENPLIRTIILLFGFFSKLLIFHQLKDRSDRSVAAALKVNTFFVKDYKKAASNYSFPKLISIIGLLREYDLKAKGVNNTSTPDGELLREMLYRILC
ncbi:MAG: DNA polymerase III subunit delta [Bacteroidales bacterium]|nr:DNA polymerase III subunit delta [Bacteroidales bacterium]